MYLATNDHAIQISATRTIFPFECSPLFSTPLLHSITARSFPDLFAAVATDDIFSFA